MARRRGSSGFEHLLSPGRIGPLTLRNRVLMAGMDMNLCHDGEIVAGDVDHFAARARGGVGMIITGASAVAYPSGAASRKEPGLSEDRFIPGLRMLADAIHDAGSALCVQLVHHGAVARVDVADERPLLVPSKPRGRRDMSALQDSTAEELTRMADTTAGKRPTFREATDEDLAQVVADFVSAARRVREAGGDAIEIHVAHGYLLGAFLCRADNDRTDKWGGSLENRARLAVEVIRAVKAEVGGALAVLVRLAGREYGEEGALTTEEAVAAARMFQDAGAEAIHVTGWARNPFRDFTTGPVPSAVGAYQELARAVKGSVDIPVVAVGRVLPELGEKMIADGDADFVAMGRQLLTDPDLVAKLAAGTPEQVRPCISCFVCVDQNFYDDTPRCAVNPALGDERLATSLPVSFTRHVVVVGGGPGGMEAARVAAERGHRVTLVEAGDRLGGTAWFSQLTTPDNGPFVEWQTRELARLGVTVELNRSVDAEQVQALRPDAVVVATGAHRGRPGVPGAELPHVHTGDSLRGLLTGSGDAGDAPLLLRAVGTAGRLTRATRNPALIRAATKKFLPVGKDVVVIGGSLVGLELAEFLAERGRDVTVLEPGPNLGLPMAMPRRWAAVRRAEEHGVHLVRNAVVEEITADHVRYRADDATSTAPADLVVVATDVTPTAPLADDLRAQGVEVHVVGDAGEVGYIEGAVNSAWKVARAL